MEVTRISFDRIKALTSRDTDYQLNPNKFSSFLSYQPDENGILSAATERNKFPLDRDLLADVLTDHYRLSGMSDLQKNNILRLRQSDTYTVVTAHQPCLFGGPAYYFYKIFSVINLSRQMSDRHPGLHFVPVLVTGSEDHDFEEMKSAYLFGKYVKWDTDQKGPVGRYKTEGLDTAVEEFCGILGDNTTAAEMRLMFSDALKKAKTYSDFVFDWVNVLFRKYGLLVVNMDDKRFKRAFLPFMKAELLEQKSFLPVKHKQDELTRLGFKPQAFVREINLFYMDDGIRERIVFDNGIYHVNNTELRFSKEELIKELEEYPEHFSPNVVLRPVYQEFILPNLVYIGGGGEIAYWMERKDQFAAFGVFFPILMRRNSFTLIPKSVERTMAKNNISTTEIVNDEEELINLFLERSAGTDFHLNKESAHLEDLFRTVADKARSVDPTLEHFVLGEGHKAVKALENIEHRLKKSLKQKEETSVQQIRAIRQKLFPGNGLQERKDNFFQFMVSEGPDFMEKLIDLADPLKKDFLFVNL